MHDAYIWLQLEKNNKFPVLRQIASQKDAKKGEHIETQRLSRWILVKNPLESPHASVHAFLTILNGSSQFLQEYL